MNSTLTYTSLFLGAIAALILGSLPPPAYSQGLPGGKTKEEICAAIKSGNMPQRPEGGMRPPDGVQPPGGFKPPEGATPGAGGTKGQFTPPNIDCSDQGAGAVPQQQQAQPPAYKNSPSAPVDVYNSKDAEYDIGGASYEIDAIGTIDIYGDAWESEDMRKDATPPGEALQKPLRRGSGAPPEDAGTPTNGVVMPSPLVRQNTLQLQEAPVSSEHFEFPPFAPFSDPASERREVEWLVSTGRFGNLSDDTDGRYQWAEDTFVGWLLSGAGSFLGRVFGW